MNAGWVAVASWVIAPPCVVGTLHSAPARTRNAVTLALGLDAPPFTRRFAAYAPGMSCHHGAFTLSTSMHDQVVDITAEVRRLAERSGIADGVVTVFAPHATAAITVNENDDPNIGTDFLEAMKKLVVEHGWLHDRVDDNAAAHIKAALIGPSVSIPLESGRLVLGRWQNVFFCEFDGPRATRHVRVTVIG
jgi:secondary thiamine-phosphate synthase enzyme